MRVEMLSVADFYTNVDEVREFALRQEFYTEQNHFPGKRTESFLNDSVKEIIQDIIKPFAGDVTWWGDKHSGAFQYTTAVDRSWIHSDGNTDWAGVCYLTPDAPLSAGTGIFRHKATGLKNWIYKDHITEEDNIGAKDAPHRGADSIDYTKWDMVDRLGNVYNRLILYRGDLFHVSLDYFGKDLQDGRLFQTFFFNTEK
jgi:hypothetical protein